MLGGGGERGGWERVGGPTFGFKKNLFLPSNSRRPQS